MPLTDFIDRFEPGSRLRLNGEWFTVKEVSWHKNQVILRLEGINHILKAEELRRPYLKFRLTPGPSWKKTNI